MRLCPQACSCEVQTDTWLPPERSHTHAHVFASARWLPRRLLGFLFVWFFFFFLIIILGEWVYQYSASCEEAVNLHPIPLNTHLKHLFTEQSFHILQIVPSQRISRENDVNVFCTERGRFLNLENLMSHAQFHV